MEDHLIKFSVCLYKNPDIPYEDFIRWCTEQYPVRAAPIMKKHGILKWTQVSTYFYLCSMKASRDLFQVP